MKPARIILAAAVAVAFLFSAASAQARFEPGLNKVGADKGEIFRFGCLTGVTKLKSPRCYFGDVKSHRNVVIFGDSHAMQWGPGLIHLAKRKHWRVIVLTRASCTAALVKLDTGCNIWRRNSLRRIRKMKAGMVVVASAANSELYQEVSQDDLIDGMTRTLRKLRANSKRTVLIRDQAVTPFNVTGCLRSNQSSPDRCGFAPGRSKSYSYDYIAARRVSGVRIIDPMRMLCPGGWCRAVDQNIIVYRNQGHLSATFTRSKYGWLGHKLGDPWK